MKVSFHLFYELNAYRLNLEIGFVYERQSLAEHYDKTNIFLNLPA